MTDRICKLPLSVSNQIAAGEVIERPAAALKELIENSLDAKATKICIDIVGGGADLLRVQDDGEGIVGDDLEVALQPHATSKITTAEDLSAIITYGFRGEALASLAAVSTLTIASCRAKAAHGYEYSLKMDSPTPKAMSPGTLITVRGLFSDLPARRRFLRSPTTEAAHCLTTVRNVALANGAGFEFSVNEKPRLSLLPTDDMTARFIDIFPSVKDNTVAIFEEAGNISLSGVILSPSLGYSATRVGQYFYLNNRFMRDKLLRRAIAEALRNLTHSGEPGYALYLNLPANFVDVNVHPSKLEARFLEPRAIFDFVRRSIVKAMKTPLGAPVSIEPPTHSTAHDPRPAAVQYSGGINRSADVPGRLLQKQAADTSRAIDAWRQMFSAAADDKAIESSPAKELDSNENFTLGRALGQLHDIYIIAENHHGLVVVDMHAAHERILLEELKKSDAVNGIVMQPLLATEKVSLSPTQAATLAAADDLCGIIATAGADDTAMITAIASLIVGKAAPAQLLIEILDDLAKHGDGVLRLRERQLSVIACHAAVRANRRLSVEEMNVLLRRMEETEFSGVCNHGRPCWRQIDISYFDRIFSRGR